MKTVDDIIIFEDDRDFQNWAIEPELKTYQDSNGYYYTDWDFTKEYERAIKENKRLAIKDRKSRILVNNQVYYRSVTKPVQNVGPYFSFMDRMYHSEE